MQLLQSRSRRFSQETDQTNQKMKMEYVLVQFDEWSHTEKIKIMSNCSTLCRIECADTDMVSSWSGNDPPLV